MHTLSIMISLQFCWWQRRFPDELTDYLLYSDILHSILCVSRPYSWFWGLSPVFMGFGVVVVVDCICEIFISMSSCRQYVCWLTFHSIGKVPSLHTHLRWRHILNINTCHKFLDQISNQGLFPMTTSFVTEHGKWTWGYILCTSSLSFEAPDKHWYRYQCQRAYLAW